MIACVGETLEQREAGTTMQVVAAQTKAIAGISFKTILVAASSPIAICRLQKNDYRSCFV